MKNYYKVNCLFSFFGDNPQTKLNQIINIYFEFNETFFNLATLITEFKIEI